ncbi:hypothetical protein INT43_008160 [Umbelopsis isabellina]|uniref:Myb-like domain-containing protein n=1 Tax=Mortierella isabellina TaxID=91625 RepID=A0A8H7PD87_MORIS|nr:hypothetical protein INT43_008160 [Umbelopsis isabellina]
MFHSAPNGSSSKSEKAAVYEKPSKKSLLSISRKRKVGSSEDEVYSKRPALITSNGATAPAEGHSTEHIAKELERWSFMMKDKPQEQQQESKARGDSDDEFWKQAAEMYADEDTPLEDDTREEAEPETPTFDDLPSPIVQELVEKMEEDNDTPMIPESNEVSDDHTDTELAIAQDDSTIDYPKESESSEKPAVVRKKVPGENTFSHDCVKTWSPARIHAWEIRRLNPEAFYYRFVDPAQGQSNGSFTKADHDNFMKRMEVWKEKGYRVGASWGIFSMGIPHRAGYQCSAYYRKLIQSKKIQDDAYAMVDGKLKMVDKSRTNAGEVATSELSEAWQTDEVQAIEKEVEQWLREYHNRGGSIAVKKPAAPKPKAAPRVHKSTAAKSGDIAALVKQNIGVGDFRLLSDEEAFMLAAEPSAIKVRRRNWDEIWQASLKEYRQFVEGFQDPQVRRKYHEEKRKWRKGLTTTEYASAIKRTSQAPNITSSSIIVNNNAVKKATQLSLASFFSGVKKVKPKADTPDEFISRYVIPNELFSGVKHMRGLYNEKRINAPDAKTKYWELNDMNDCITILDETLQTVPDKPFHNAIEGVLIDPPWDFYVADGRNDGRYDVPGQYFETYVGWTDIYVDTQIYSSGRSAHDVLVRYFSGCKYVENLVWFKKTLSNVLQDRPSPYFSSSKEILLMFKKGDGFELRHQRTADVIIDFERPTDQWIHEEYTELKPPGVYDMIETLLPKAGYDEALGRGRLLELWAKRQTPRREGWLAFHDIKPEKEAEIAELPTEDILNVSSMIVDSIHSEESSADRV